VDITLFKTYFKNLDIKEQKMKQSIIILNLIIFLTLIGCDDKYIQDEEQKIKSQEPINQLYDDLPDISTCYEGVLKDSEKLNALNTINEIRTLHHLKPVEYNYEEDHLVAKSALISVANATLNHNPSINSKCYTKEGQLGSNSSNLHIGYQNNTDKVYLADHVIIRFLVDSNTKTIGHRRWILFPFLKTIAYGRVDAKIGKYNTMITAITLKVINDEMADISDTEIEYIAYPYENYPSNYFKHGWYSSFSVLFDKTDRWKNRNVDYRNAKITVTDENGKKLSIKSIKYNTDGAGLPNILQWKIGKTKNKKKYRVKIENVLVNGEQRDYSYWFKIF